MKKLIILWNFMKGNRTENSGCNSYSSGKQNEFYHCSSAFHDPFGRQNSSYPQRKNNRTGKSSSTPESERLLSQTIYEPVYGRTGSEDIECVKSSEKHRM